MAYKFQLGAAKLSGSITQSSGSAIEAAAVFKIGNASVTEAQLEILDGATVSTDELNILDGVTANASELNILDGVTANASELNILDGATLTTAHLNTVDGAAAGTITNNKVVVYDGSGRIKANGYLNSSNAVVIDTNGNVDANSLSVGGAAITSTPAELNILDGVTATTAELNILDGVTSTAAELNILDGVTSTAAELNILDGVTSTTAELNILDGVTSNATELNLLDGAVSSNNSNAVKAAVLDASNNLTIAGNLIVNGTTTTVDTDNLTVKDANIVLRQGGAGNADGIGFTFGSTSNTQTLQTRDSSGTQKLGSSLPLSASAFYGDGSNLTNIGATDAIVSTSDIADTATSSVGGAGFKLAGQLSQDSMVHLSNSAGANQWIDGEVVYIKLNDANNTLKIKPSGTQHIDGVAGQEIILETQGAAVTLIKVGTDNDSGWFIV